MRSRRADDQAIARFPVLRIDGRTPVLRLAACGWCRHRPAHPPAGDVIVHVALAGRLDAAWAADRACIAGEIVLTAPAAVPCTLEPGHGDLHHAWFALAGAAVTPLLAPAGTPAAVRCRARALGPLLARAWAAAAADDAALAAVALGWEVADVVIDSLARPDALASALHAYERFLRIHPERGLAMRWHAPRIGLTPAALAKRFRAQFGVAPSVVLRAARLERARALLGRGATASEAARACGYSGPRALRAALRRRRSP